MTYHPSKRWEIVEIAVIVHHETAKAWLMSVTGDEDDAKWVPKSMSELDGNTLSIPRWMAEEKGFWDPVRSKP